MKSWLDPQSATIFFLHFYACTSVFLSTYISKYIRKYISSTKSPQPATWSAPTNHGQDPSSPGFPGTYMWSFYFYFVFLFLSGLHVFAVFLFILGVRIIIGFLYFTFCPPGIQVFAKPSHPASIGWVAVSSLVGCRHRPASVDLSISHFVSSPCFCCFYFKFTASPHYLWRRFVYVKCQSSSCRFAHVRLDSKQA